MSFQTLFTPIFIIITICIILVGVVVLQFLDKLFAGSKNITAIKLFGVAVIINIVILVFILMSFARVKFNPGPEGPQGNKGVRGNEGSPGGLVVCKPNPRTAQEQKAIKKSATYLDLKPPYLEEV